MFFILGIYTLLLELLYFLASPVLFAIFRNKPDCERLTVNYPKNRFDILVHTASVGEINGVRQLLLELLNSNPNLNVLLTTNTKTGRKIAQDIHDRITAVLSPLDLLHLRIIQIRRSRPRLILIAETEIWPNLLWAAKIYKIAVVFVNARVAPGTLKAYTVFRNELKWLGKSVKAICAQSEADRARFAEVFETDCVNAGNLKFSVMQPEFDAMQLRHEFGYEKDDKIIVIGSSRPGEEQLLINSLLSLKGEIEKVKLIIAPRHLDRVPAITAIAPEPLVSLYSRQEQAKDVHILDVMGKLQPAYAICDVAVIGGSFFPYGGHNPLEAAFYGKIIVMGQYHDSCRGTVDRLKKAEAVIISSANDLTEHLRKMLSQPEEYSPIGQRAKKVLMENRESLPKHLQIIYKHLV